METALDPPAADRDRLPTSAVIEPILAYLATDVAAAGNGLGFGVGRALASGGRGGAEAPRGDDGRWVAKPTDVGVEPEGMNGAVEGEAAA